MDSDNKTNNSALHFAEEALRALGHHDGTGSLKDLPIWLPLGQELEACRSAAQILGIETLSSLCQRLNEHLGPIQNGLFEPGPSAIQNLVKDLNHWVATRRSLAAFGLIPLEVEIPKAATAPARTKTFISDMSKYLPLFVEETEEGFEIMQTHFLAIETGVKNSGFLPNPDLINELFRHAHKIKASAGAMGFTALSELTHTMETLLDQIRNNRLRIGPELVSALLLALDKMRGEVETAKLGKIPTGNLGEALASLQWYLDTPAESGPAHSSPSAAIPADLLEEVATPSEMEEAATALQRGFFTFKVSLEIDASVPAPEMRLMLAAKHLSEFGVMINPSTPIESLDSQNDLKTLSFLFQTKQLEAAIRDSLLSIEVTSVQIHLIAGREATAQSQAAAPLASQSIRVSTDRLDTLMNLSGELAISKNSFIAVSEQLKARGKASESVGTALEESIQQLAVLTTGIQQLVLEMRMVPISPLFERCRRIVRDLATELGKKIDLVLIGAETSLDKKIIDQLGDPLNHMVRNSVDHGIESAEERRAAGKPPVGTITVRAEREGSRICITISDDGKGIPVETIRNRIVELGLVANGAAADMKNDQLIPFIFHPGLSTAQKVTSISGRGVGMDIVRKRIEEINGTVEVRSTEGRGATFKILLPLTVVSQTCLLFEFQKTIFASALQNVSEILRVDPSKVAQMRFGNYLRIRDDLVPLFDFTHFFKKSSFVGTLLKSPAPINVVVLKTGAQRIALSVDRLLGEEEVIVKSMGPLVGDIEGLAGVSLLSTGGVALILDVEYLVGKTSPSKEVAHEQYFAESASPS